MKNFIESKENNQNLLNSNGLGTISTDTRYKIGNLDNFASLPDNYSKNDTNDDKSNVESVN